MRFRLLSVSATESLIGKGCKLIRALFWASTRRPGCVSERQQTQSLRTCPMCELVPVATGVGLTRYDLLWLHQLLCCCVFCFSLCSFWIELKEWTCNLYLQASERLKVGAERKQTFWRGSLSFLTDANWIFAKRSMPILVAFCLNCKLFWHTEKGFINI